MPDFSTPALHAIEQTHTLPSSSSPTASLSLFEKYDIPTTLRAILDGGYKTVALQFPDEMLGESVLVYRGLMAGLKEAESRGEGGEGVQCFVIGDSTYGSCCPDILSAMHLPADFLIHYGHACLTPTTALPVLYIFPKLLFPRTQIDTAAQELYKAASASLTTPITSDGANGLNRQEEGRGKKGVVIVWDVGYDWVEDQIREAFLSAPNRPGSSIPLIFGHIKRHHDEKPARRSAQRKASRSAAVNPGGGCCGNAGDEGCENGGNVEVGCCSTGTAGVESSRTSCGCRGEDKNVETELAHGLEGVILSNQASGVGFDTGDNGPQQEEIVDLGGIQVQIPLTADGDELPQPDPSHVRQTSSDDASKGIADGSGPATSGDDEPATGSLRVMNLTEGLQMKDCVIFYIGEESRGMINLMMENARSEIWQYSPATFTTTPLHLRTPMLLRPRLFSLSRFLSLTTIGILVHNVGLHSSRPLIKKIKDELKRKGKKSYTVSVGRLNPAKVGNLEVVEGWVLVGCREGGMVDPKEYAKPIVTPHELFLALQGESGIARWADADRFGWTLDMGKVMREAELLKKEEESDSDGDDSAAEEIDRDRPVFSLVSGRYHSTTHAAHSVSDSESDDERDNTPSTALALRSTDNAVSRHVRTLTSTASTHLANRSYKGLDPLEGYSEEGKLEPSVLEEGRRGVARGYGMVGDGEEGKTQGTS